MTTFAQAMAQRRAAGATPPPRTLALPPSVFASEWEGRPAGPVVVGLRLLSEADEQTARGEAIRLAAELAGEDAEGAVEAYNDALVRWVVARGLCDPNDVTQPSQLFPMAEDMVRVALTSAGARFIFDAIEKLQIETSPAFLTAADEDVERLAARLARPKPLVMLHRAAELRARRLLAFVLSELEAADPETDEPAPAPVDTPDP